MARRATSRSGGARDPGAPEGAGQDGADPDLAAALRRIPAIRVQPASKDPYEDLEEQDAAEGGFFGRHRVFSRHNRDLYLFMLAFAAIIAAIAGVSLYSLAGNRASALQFILGSAILGALLTVVTKLFDTAQKRLAIADLFVGEITSIIRVFVSANIVGAFVDLHLAVGEARGAPLTGFADTARKENYFAIYDKNSGDLGMLSSHIVENVAAFYTFFKASRDATGSLALWKEPGYPDAARKNDIANILHICLLMAIHGRKAIERLLEDEKRRDYAAAQFKTVELQCFLFLDQVLPKGDPRLARLEARRERYVEMVVAVEAARGAGSVTAVGGGAV